MPVSTVVVWVLILWTGNGPVVIDNIDSKAHCEAFARIYAGMNGSPHSNSPPACIAVRKVTL